MVQKIKVSEILRKADISLSECNLPRAERYLLKAKGQLASPSLLNGESYFENIDLYLNINRSLARIYLETREAEKLKALFDELNGIFKNSTETVVKEKFISLVAYIKGIDQSFKKHYTSAFSHFETALSSAYEANDIDSRIYAVWGLIIVNYETENYFQAQKYLCEFDELLKQAVYVSADSFESASLIVKAHIASRLEKYDEALIRYWDAHKVLRKSRNWYLHYYVLLGIGNTYKTMGDERRAALFYDAILRAIEPTQVNQLRNIVKSVLSSLSRDISSGNWKFSKAHAFVGGKASSSADRRFIPFEILYVLTRNPNKVFSVEELAKVIWPDEIFSPSTHLMKIHENIVRIRKLVEIDENRPRYIVSTGEGFVYSSKSGFSLFDDSLESFV